MAKQVPWKAPYIHSVDSIDVEKIKKVPLPKMKSKARLFRHEVEMTTRFVNYELIPNIEKPNINLDNYDELKMLALLLSGTLDMGMVSWPVFLTDVVSLERQATSINEHYIQTRITFRPNCLLCNIA